MADYCEEFPWLHVSAKKRRVELEGQAVDVDQLRCSHCASDWHVTKEATNNILQTITEHAGRAAHINAVKAAELSSRIDRPKNNRLVEDPKDFQEKMLLALMRDGLSVEFTDGQFFKEFLVPRFHQFAAIQSVSNLRLGMVKAYDLDKAVIKNSMEGKAYWLGIDETPDSMNRPLLHVMATYLPFNLLECTEAPSYNSIRRVLIASDSIDGKCGADVVVEKVETAVAALKISLKLNLGLSSDSASYMGKVGRKLAKKSGSAGSYVLLHCPSHLIHDLMMKLLQWKVNPADELPWMKSALDFMTAACSVSKLRDLATMFERVQQHSTVRWCTVGDAAVSVYDQWDDFSDIPANVFTRASETPAGVRKITEFKAADALLKAKIHLLKLVGEAWKPSIMWFESNEPRGTDCLSALEEFDSVVETWVTAIQIDTLVDDIDNRRGVNEAVATFTANVQALGAFVLEKWRDLRENVTESQIKFWKQMKVFDPSHKAEREEEDDFYLELLNRISTRLGYTNEQKNKVSADFKLYLNTAFNRVLNSTSEVWDYWAAKLRVWPTMSQLVLILLMAPIGNSELERSFRLVKVGSLASTRQTGSVETKSVVNLAHVNGSLNLADISPPQAQ